MVHNTVLHDMLNLGKIVDEFFNVVPQRTGRNGYPALDIYEGTETIEVKAIMPGVDRESLDIELSEKTLTISGEKKQEDENRNYLRRERVFGKFSRSIELPYQVDNDSIRAELKNGVLSITLTKSEDARPRKIEIN